MIIFSELYIWRSFITMMKRVDNVQRMMPLAQCIERAFAQQSLQRFRAWLVCGYLYAVFIEQYMSTDAAAAQQLKNRFISLIRQSHN
jgi:hypothetical protein